MKGRLTTSMAVASLLAALFGLRAQAADIYVCTKPKEGLAGSPTGVRPGEDCPATLRPGCELVIEFELGNPAPLEIEAVFARTADTFDLPDDLEVVAAAFRRAEGGPASQRLAFDAAPYGEQDNQRFLTLVPAEWLVQGRNQVALSLRRVDFPGVEFRLASLRVSTGPISDAARQAYDAAVSRRDQKVRESVATTSQLNKALTGTSYRVAVENSLRKLFQDEIELIFEECQDATVGNVWSLRRSRLVGQFLPSLLGRDTSPDPDAGGERRPELVLEACRNERERGQIVLVPCTSDLARVNVACEGLRGPGGFTIGPERVDIRIVGYVKTQPPRYDHEYLGWWPDVLLPNFGVNVFVGQIQPVWVTVHVPPDAPAGDYEGRVRVAPANAPATDVPFKLRVWDFVLPNEPFLQTQVEMGTGWIWRFYSQHPESNPEGLSDEAICLNFVQSLLEHRLSPFTLGQDSGLIVPKTGENGGKTWDYSRFDRVMEFALEHGLSRFAAGTVFANDLANTDRQEELIDLYAHLVQKGWFDRAYYYGIDEGYGDLPRMYALAKRLLPGVRTLTTTTHRADLETVLDIFVPRTGDDWAAYASRGVPERLRQAGKEYWVYTSGFPAPPVWPQVYVDCPAIDHRIIPWTCARWGMTGYLKVPLTSWYHVEDKRMDYQTVRTPWDVNPGIYGDSNGEILMLYCGPKGQMLPSVRLAVLRDGIEDYDYHTILSRLAEQLRKSPSQEAQTVLKESERLLDLSDLVVKPYQFPRQPYVEKLFERRRAMARAIEAAKMAVQAKTDPVPAPPPSWRAGPLWCAAVQAMVNNVRPSPVTITVVNQSGDPFAGVLKASGPRGWRLQPDSWNLDLAKGGLQRIRTEVILDEDAEVLAAQSLITLSAHADQGVQEFKVSVSGVRCRGFWTIGPFKPALTGTSTKPLPPEQKIDLKGSYPGASGQPVAWRELLLPYSESRIDFDRIYGTPPTKYVPQSPKENFSNVAYCLSWVSAGKEKSLVLKLDGPNRMKAWLNGKPVFGGVEEDLGAVEEGKGGEDEGLGTGAEATGKEAAGSEVQGSAQKEVSLSPGSNVLLIRLEKSVGKAVGDWSVEIEFLRDGRRADDLLWRLTEER